MTVSAPYGGIVLAGGRARRMGGGDKPLATIAGRPMLGEIIDRLSPQAGKIVISANGDPRRFSRYGWPIVADAVPGFAGPLAGLLAGLRWFALYAAEVKFVVSVAGDTPFFPRDLTERLAAAAEDEEGAIPVAASAGRVHPVFALWPVAIVDDLAAFLAGGDNPKVLAFIDRFRRRDVAFEPIALADGRGVDPFFNINTPADLMEAEGIAGRLRGAAA